MIPPLATQSMSVYRTPIRRKPPTDGRPRALELTSGTVFCETDSGEVVQSPGQAQLRELTSVLELTGPEQAGTGRAASQLSKLLELIQSPVTGQSEHFGGSMDSEIDSVPRTSCTNPTSSTSIGHRPLQLFYKFHMERYDPGFYLTTNPTLRHVQCRMAPGYFVRVHRHELDSASDSVNGPLGAIRMDFEDIATGEPIAVVTCSELALEYEVMMSRAIRNGKLVRFGVSKKGEKRPGSDISKKSLVGAELCTGRREESDRLIDGLLQDSIHKSPRPTMRGSCARSSIPSPFYPLPAPWPSMRNYAATIGQNKFHLGRIPQARDRYFPQLLETKKTPKWIRKRHMYLHQEFMGNNTQYADMSLALVVALMRPCESQPKKRFLRKLHSLSRSSPARGFVDLRRWKPDWDWRECAYLPEPGFRRPSEGLHLLLPDVKPYTEVGDGLFFVRNPADDEPNHVHKYGWLTVYDLAALAEEGVFDAAVALLVAASYWSWSMC